MSKLFSCCINNILIVQRLIEGWNRTRGKEEKDTRIKRKKERRKELVVK